MIKITRLVLALVFATGSAALVTAASPEKRDKRVLTLDDARIISAAAETEAKRLHAGGAIAVVDDGGHAVLLVRLDDTFPAGAAVALEKARTAAVFRRPTRDFEEAIRSGRTSLLGVNVMTPLQGGVPIVVNGQVIGAVGVSGAASAQQDDEIAKAAADALGS